MNPYKIIAEQEKSIKKLNKVILRQNVQNIFKDTISNFIVRLRDNNEAINRGEFNGYKKYWGYSCHHRNLWET